MPKAAITLETLFKELKKIDTKNDARNHLLQIELESVKSAVGDLKADIEDLKGEVNARFTRIEAKLDSTFKQVGKTYEELTAIKSRVRKLEGPSA